MTPLFLETEKLLFQSILGFHSKVVILGVVHKFSLMYIKKKIKWPWQKIINSQIHPCILIRLIAEILHQLRLVGYPIIYNRVLYIPGGDRRISEPPTVSSHRLVMGPRRLVDFVCHMKPGDFPFQCWLVRAFKEVGFDPNLKLFNLKRPCFWCFYFVG